MPFLHKNLLSFSAFGRKGTCILPRRTKYHLIPITNQLSLTFTNISSKQQPKVYWQKPYLIINVGLWTDLMDGNADGWMDGNASILPHMQFWNLFVSPLSRLVFLTKLFIGIIICFIKCRLIKLNKVNPELVKQRLISIFRVLVLPDSSIAMFKHN